MALKPLPATKDNYRYFWAEDDEPLCTRYIKESNSGEENKKRISQLTFIKRKVIPTLVRLSESDRAPQLKINDEFNKVTGEKGYSMVRATHGINRGKFYFEVRIEAMPDKSATRIGWSQRFSNLQAPLGYDHYGYSWRSRFGTKFHQAIGKTYDKQGGYGEGDTLGCMIELPYGNDRNQTRAHHLPTSAKEISFFVPIKKKTIGMLEERDEPPTLESMKPLIGSKISFYKNGRCVGIAFDNIFEGFYYPTISLYKSCVASVNFGPKFKYPPEKFNQPQEQHSGYLPVQEIAEISTIDNFLSDLVYIVDQELNVESGINNLDDKIKTSLQT